MSSHSQIASSLPATPCEACGSLGWRLLFATADRLQLSTAQFHIIECTACGLWQTLPEMREAELARFYPHDYWGGEPSEKWIQSSQSDKTEFVKQCRLEGGRILDVGCGAGFFLRALDARSWVRYGVEIGEQAAGAAAQALGSQQIFKGSLLEANFDKAAFDVVSFWSALEHTNEPRMNLLEARRILKQGGTIIIQVPNAASYQAKFFKGDWFSLDAPRHRFHFNLRNLRQILEATGFAIYHHTFQSKVHNSHALRQSLKARLWHRSPPGRAAFLLSIPLLKPFDYLLSASGKGATMTVAARAV
jgi:2-polyprenyl-3-methyl-5-hydroxy-6-metoxy-1,4-benzoquinol methylase